MTLIVAVPEEVCVNSTRHDILEKLLVSLKPGEVSCIQFVLKRYVRVTFKSFEARQDVLKFGVSIDSVRLIVFEADPVTAEVSLENLSFEVPDDEVRKALSPYGVVHDVRLQNYAGTDIYSGTRILKMSLASDIPVNLRVLRYPCRVFYRGQPRPCPICRSDNHRVYSCPLRDNCRIRLQPGYFARDCKPDSPDSDPSYVPDEESDDGSADDVPNDEEFNSGDDEVVEATTADTPSSNPSPAPNPLSIPEPPSVSDPRSDVLVVS